MAKFQIDYEDEDEHEGKIGVLINPPIH